MLAQTRRFVTEIICTDLAIVAVDRLEDTTKVAVADVSRARVAIVADDIYWLTYIVRTRIRRARVVIFTFRIVTGGTWDDARYDRRICTTDIYVTEILRTGHLIITYSGDIDSGVYATKLRATAISGARVIIITLNKVVLTNTDTTKVVTRIISTRIVVRTVCRLEYTADFRVAGIYRTAVVVLTSDYRMSTRKQCIALVQGALVTIIAE